jgi:hypothetical protein
MKTRAQAAIIAAILGAILGAAMTMIAQAKNNAGKNEGVMIVDSEKGSIASSNAERKVSFYDYTENFSEFVDSIKVPGLTYLEHVTISAAIEPEASFGKRGNLTLDGSENWGLSTGKLSTFLSSDNKKRLDVTLLYTESYMGRDYLGYARTVDPPIDSGESIVCFDNLLAIVTTNVKHAPDDDIESYGHSPFNMEAVYAVNNALLEIYGQ